MRPARTLFFWVLAAALVVAHAVVAWHSLVVQRLWEDEAFNLTVPLNLLAGLGYTSDGALSGSQLTPFDPRISTGVSVLLPAAAVLATGIDPVIGARLVPLAYWIALLAGLAVLGRRIGGRWAALATVAAALAFHSGLTISPIQGPADLLGEIPSAALIVWALVVLPRRAWLAGLVLGFAVQAKLIALLALPAFAVALWILTPGSGRERIVATLKRSILPLGLVALPTFLVEVAALLSLGFEEYVRHLRALGSFVRSGGQSYAPTTPPEKALTLLSAWYVPWWFALVVVIVSIALIAGGLFAARRPQALPSGVNHLVAASFTGIVAYVGWWAAASHLPLWVRHPAPGVFAFVPLLAALAVWGAQAIWRALPERRAVAARAAVAFGCCLLFAGLGVGSAAHAASSFPPPGAETLAAQRAAVADIREWVDEEDVTWLAAHPWGAPTSAVVLSGAHLGLFDAPAMRETPRLTHDPCPGVVLVDGPVYRVCAPE